MKINYKFLLTLLISPIFFLVTSCATIVGDASQNIGIRSNPADAKVSITDERGLQVFSGMTPTSVTLNKSDGSYFGGIDYMVEVSKPGYQSAVISVTPSLNGWYMGGNLIFGGIIGWLIVDPFNGKMYTLNPKEVSANLSKQVAKNDSELSLEIKLIEEIPEDLRDKLVAVN